MTPRKALQRLGELDPEATLVVQRYCNDLQDRLDESTARANLTALLREVVEATIRSEAAEKVTTDTLRQMEERNGETVLIALKSLEQIAENERVRVQIAVDNAEAERRLATDASSAKLASWQWWREHVPGVVKHPLFLFVAAVLAVALAQFLGVTIQDALSLGGASVP